MTNEEKNSLKEARELLEAIYKDADPYCSALELDLLDGNDWMKDVEDFLERSK